MSYQMWPRCICAKTEDRNIKNWQHEPSCPAGVRILEEMYANAEEIRRLWPELYDDYCARYFPNRRKAIEDPTKP